MAKLLRTDKGIGYLTLDYIELVEYTGNPRLICDECLKPLSRANTITLVPILNEAFCDVCYKERLERLEDYPEDRTIRARREEHFKRYFNLEEADNE